MASPPGHSQDVLPDSEHLVLEGIVRTDNRFVLHVSARQAAVCPRCGRTSRPRHSTYIRRLAGSSLARPTRGDSSQRRPVSMSAPRLPKTDLHATASACGPSLFATNHAGGRDHSGGRLRRRRTARTGATERLAIYVSDDTVLRRVKSLPAHPSPEPIHNLGVDDWAWRKG